MTTLFDLARHAAAAHPDRTAVEASGSGVSYKDLSRLVERLGTALVDAGVRPGDRVGVAAGKSVDTVAAILAASAAGAAYVPIDPTAPPSRGAFVLSDCGVRAFVADRERGESLVPALRDAGATLRNATTASDLTIHAVDRPPPASVSPGLACILYTSGSTGRPKGVMVSNEAAISFVEWACRVFEPRPEDRFASHAPFHFDLSIFDLFVAFASGSTVVLVDDAVSRLPDALASFVAEARITVWYSTPTVLTWMARAGGLADREYPDLRLALFAGEVFPPRHLRVVREAWPGARFFNLYGPTETNVCTWFEIPPEVPPEREAPYPIGRACDHVRVRVMRHEGDREDEGELLVAGAPVMEGYWDRPDLTAEAFHEGEGGTRWYRTGDVVRVDGDGQLVFLGRRDRMVKRRGHRIELGEIEAALLRHGAVEEAAALPATDADGATTIEVFVRWVGTGSPSGISLRRFCAEHLPRSMIPDRFHFVDALPTTSTHKTDYRRLAGSRP